MGRNQKGFTLIEILIASTLLAVGISALLSALGRGMFAGSADIDNRATALHIAQARMEILRNTVYSGIVSSPRAADTTFSNFYTTVTANSADPERVDVLVDWSVPGGTDSYTLSSLFSNYQ
ncbi:MAG: prepilin-type N-terminal cleavage/methylation domain-containing protein [Candidatus Omnitrophica bacterium]|nr:prepilin-type N-terminal cleavage/methylation domain-containing protein [Candidatus Omnitrophota bacterium]